MSNKYDFDQLDTYVAFTYQGNEYHFYYPTLAQTLEIDGLKEGDETKATNFMFSMVKKPEGATYPDFSEVADQMNAKQIALFKEMITTELGIEA